MSIVIIIGGIFLDYVFKSVMFVNKLWFQWDKTWYVPKWRIRIISKNYSRVCVKVILRSWYYDLSLWTGFVRILVRLGYSIITRKWKNCEREGHECYFYQCVSERFTNFNASEWPSNNNKKYSLMLFTKIIRWELWVFGPLLT